MSLQGGSCKKTISDDLHWDSRSTTRSFGDLAILKDKTLIFCNVVLNIRKNWARLKPATILTITYLLVECVDLGTVEPHVPERAFQRLGVVALLPAVDAAYGMGAGALICQGRGDWEGSLLGMALAAASMITMLLPSMRLGADGTPTSTLTVEMCVAPLATVLAEGDTGMVGG